MNASKSQYPINQLAKSTKGSRRKVVKEKKPSKLKGPLSELTADFIAVPVRDMEAFVNRPLPARLEEARKKNGYISRPMNSFMLYRSAYQERTKAFCNETNHQAVSTIVGESWAIEPESVKAKYNRLAVTERDNHQAAHPDYKFRPAKNGPAPRKKAADSSKQADGKLPGSSDLDFDSQDWGATHLRKNRPKLMKRAEQDDVAYKVRKLEHSTDATFPSLEGSNMMDSLRVYNDFRSAPSATRAYPQLYNTADAQWASSQVPYQNTRPLISLPGGMNQHFYNPKPYVDVQLEVDPALLLKNTSDIGTGTSTDNGNGNGNSTSAGTGASMSQQTFRPPTAMATNQLQSAPVPYRDVQYAPAAYVASPLDNADYYNRLPIWEEDVGLRPLETGSQFDEWMGGDQETG